MSKCKSCLKKPQKKSPKWTRTQTRVQHPKEPFGTFGVLICTNVGHDSSALGLR